MPRIALAVLGCKLNQAEAQSWARALSEAGADIAPLSAPADVCLVHSCAVSREAERKSRQLLRQARRAHPGALVVAAGCAAELALQEARRLACEDVLLGHTAVGDLPGELLRWLGLAAEGNGVGSLQAPVVRRTRALVKAQDGCNQRCAYCIVPRLRGAQHSRPIGEVVAQAREMVARGYRELVLTGTQLGEYGRDGGAGEGATLAALVARLLTDTGVERLRLSSLQPQDLSQDLLALWQDGRVCPQLHLALQSGSDAVLARMRRRYDAGRFLLALERVRRAVPDLAVTTDVIAGFPGETEQDFAETLRVCRDAGFARLHAFPFSARPGTLAAAMPGQTPPSVKLDRVQRLLALAEELQAAHERSLDGTVARVLWEEEDADGWKGRAEDGTAVYAQVGAASGNTISEVCLRAGGRHLKAEPAVVTAGCG